MGKQKMKCCEKCTNHVDCSIEGELLSAIEKVKDILNMKAILRAVRKMEEKPCIHYKEADNDN